MPVNFLSKFLINGELKTVVHEDGSASLFELDYVLDNGGIARIELPDYRYWLRKEVWTVREALALSLGLNVNMVQPYVPGVMLCVPEAGLGVLSNEVCERFDALRSSILLKDEAKFTYELKATPKGFMEFFTSHYPDTTPLNMWSPNMLAERIIEIGELGYLVARIRIERFNLFFNYMGQLIDNPYCEDGRVKGACSHLIAAYDKFLKQNSLEQEGEFGYFSTEDRIKDLKKALKLKPKNVTEDTMRKWKKSWVEKGITIRPLVFQGGQENPWSNLSNSD